ncbi:hypothetical protein ACFE04_012873 [Oxalis oulophora]
MATESPNPNELHGRGSFVHHISWKAPLDDSFVLHLGGLISYDNEVCVGSWVLRDHNAMLKAASSLPMPFGPNSDMMKVMLSALLNALTFATDHNLGVDYLEIHASYEPLTCLLSGHVTVALGSENLQLYNECVDFLRSDEIFDERGTI